jgi:hypothetical protein
MKTRVILALVAAAFATTSVFAQAPQTCNVQLCNKLSRWSLDPFSHIKDKMGEQCFNVVLPKNEAVVGNVLASESRWYQGSFNPTKKSVTKVKQVYSCQ